jgi:hypothetical protein
MIFQLFYTHARKLLHDSYTFSCRYKLTVLWLHEKFINFTKTLLQRKCIKCCYCVDSTWKHCRALFYIGGLRIVYPILAHLARSLKHVPCDVRSSCTRGFTRWQRLRANCSYSSAARFDGLSVMFEDWRRYPNFL